MGLEPGGGVGEGRGTKHTGLGFSLVQFGKAKLWLTSKLQWRVLQ